MLALEIHIAAIYFAPSTGRVPLGFGVVLPVTVYNRTSTAIYDCVLEWQSYSECSVVIDQWFPTFLPHAPFSLYVTMPFHPFRDFLVQRMHLR